MIYGKLSLEDWRNISVEGEVPESSFENHNLRLFFYGTLYNRDVLQANFDDTNAKLVASIYLQPSIGKYKVNLVVQLLNDLYRNGEAQQLVTQ